MESVEWNREHVWSKSRGFPTESFDAYTDAHHLVAAERDMNSTKNNRFFEDCQDGDDDNLVDRDFGNYTCNIWEFEPRDEVKGDIARMILYMAIRYDDINLDLEVVDDPDENSDSNEPIYGDLDDLLRWHIEDPVSEKEIFRNEVIYFYQKNRNPFIDMPELVELIWGNYQDYNN
jgi:endonuclease I